MNQIKILLNYLINFIGCFVMYSPVPEMLNERFKLWSTLISYSRIWPKPDHQMRSQEVIRKSFALGGKLNQIKSNVQLLVAHYSSRRIKLNM